MIIADQLGGHVSFVSRVGAESLALPERGHVLSGDSEARTYQLTLKRLREILDYDAEAGVFRWRVKRGARIRAGDIAGCDNGEGVRVIRVDGHLYTSARLAWLWMTGEWPTGQVAHKNSNRGDLRWANLREVDASQKLMSKVVPRTNSSGVKGVYWDSRRKRWRASITLYHRTIYLGRYDSFAAAAYFLCRSEFRQQSLHIRSRGRECLLQHLISLEVDQGGPTSSDLALLNVRSSDMSSLIHL